MPKFSVLRHRRNDMSVMMPVVLRHVVITGTLTVTVDQQPLFRRSVRCGVGVTSRPSSMTSPSSAIFPYGWMWMSPTAAISPTSSTPHRPR